MIESLVENDNMNKINNIIEQTNVGYISHLGVTSKEGNRSYKSFIRDMENKKIKLSNPVEQSTVWDKIKRFESKDNK